MAQNAEIFFEHDSWPRALGWSAGFHLAVTALIVLYSIAFTGSRGQGWGTGGGGDAMGVTTTAGAPALAARSSEGNGIKHDEGRDGKVEAGGPAEGAWPTIMLKKYLSVLRH